MLRDGTAVTRGMIPTSLRGFFFLQNGPSRVAHDSPLDGRGHVTCLDFETGRVSEVRVPGSDHVVSLADIVERPWRVVLQAMLFGQKVHGGTCNTAVACHRGRWHAVEEASFSYVLRFDGTGIAPGYFSRAKLPAHSARGVRAYHYLASRGRYPLSVHGRPITDWAPARESRPFAVHSCGRSGNLLVFPIMATCFGDYEGWLRGSGRLPLHTSATSGWLIYDLKTGRATEVRTDVATDVFHVAAVRRHDDRLAIFASHVRGFLEFAHNATLPPRLTFEKHVVDLEREALVSVTEYPEANGDFPNAVAADHDLLLINRMTPATDASEVVLFDVRTEAVVDEVTLPHKTGDVLTRDGRHMVYATTDEVVIYDRVRRKVHAAFPIPERAGNFHASLLRAPSA